MIDESSVQTWHRSLLVGSIALVSLAAWVVLWRFGAVLHGPVHQHQHAAASGSAFALLFVGSWTVMTIAMMLPTSVPLVTAFHTIAARRTDLAVLVALVVAGYLSAWTGVGVVFYAGGVAVEQLAAASPWLQAHGSSGRAAVLLVAGLYQFTALKYRCLDKCRSPLSFVLGYWQGEHERRNAFRLGAHHGLFCVGCCWALMLLMFVVGASNIVWMLTLGAVMAVEKNMPWGRRISSPLGILLLIAGAAELVFA